MGDTWHVVLRDIMVILAAGSLVSFVLFAALVLWQLYRFAIEVRDESRPMLDALLDTAETVRGTARFVGDRAVPPAVTSLGLSAGAYRVIRELTRFYRGLEADSEALPPPPTAPVDKA